MKDCIFCNIDPIEYVLESNLSIAFFDKYPVNEGHVLIIPKNHVSSFFDLSIQEQHDLLALVNKTKAIIDDRYNPDGYNVGINEGESAGQTIFHCHIHLIPRYVDDVVDPEGGVRGVVPTKKNYSFLRLRND